MMCFQSSVFVLSTLPHPHSDIILLCKILSIRYLNSLMDAFNQIP